MSLEYAKHLNDGVRRIQQQFAGKDINMDKLSKIKNTLLINNQKRRNLKREFERFSDNHGRINQEQFRRLVKEYGYDINQEEIDIVFQLTKKTGKDTGLPIQAN